MLTWFALLVMDASFIMIKEVAIILITWRENQKQHGVVLVDNDEALKEQQLLSQLNGEVFVDVRDGWSK